MLSRAQSFPISPFCLAISQFWQVLPSVHLSFDSTEKRTLAFKNTIAYNFYHFFFPVQYDEMTWFCLTSLTDHLIPRLSYLVTKIQYDMEINYSICKQQERGSGLTYLADVNTSFTTDPDGWLWKALYLLSFPFLSRKSHHV